MSKADFRPRRGPPVDPDYPRLEQGRRAFLEKLGGALLVGAAASTLGGCYEGELVQLYGGVPNQPYIVPDTGTDAVDEAGQGDATPSDLGPGDAGGERPPADLEPGAAG